MFDYAVFIGKFSPVHNGHIAVMKKALEKAKFLVVVLGQSFEARNTRLPFTEEERINIIDEAIDHDERVLYAHSENFLYNDNRWVSYIQKAVRDEITFHMECLNDDREYEDLKICLAGLNKDSTSYYLGIFPQWRYAIDVEPFMIEYKGRQDVLSSTMIRNKIFSGEIEYLRQYMPEKSFLFMKNIIEENPAEFERLVSDFKYEQSYSAKYGHGPFLTVDACVIQAGHILLIRRGKEYGHRLWALPGGFVNPGETLVDAMLRELDEETTIKVPRKVLLGSIKANKIYDNPHRSNRAHIITNCFKIELSNVADGLPKVKGSDDADIAEWVPISEAMALRANFFEDHFHVISDILGV